MKDYDIDMVNRKVLISLLLLTMCLLFIIGQKFTVQKRFAGPSLLERIVHPTPIPFRFEQIYNDRAFTEPTCEGCTTILVTGDVLTARTVNQKTVQSQNFTWPFEKTADQLRSADITFINLETPLVKNCPIRIDGMVFCGDPRNVEGLLFAGVDVVTYANNHAGNAGKSGVLETLATLRNAGIAVTGVDGPVVKEIDGVKFGFVGLNDVEKYGFVADVTGDRLQQEIGAARKIADVVIVQFHWGEEYRYQPTQRQRQLAKEAVDAGADLVLGNHPHWIQPAEMYKDKLIVYSHGNFVFDQMWSKQTREGIVGTYTFRGETLVDVAFFPIYIENYGQPRWLEGKEKSSMLELLKKESKKLQ